MSEPTPNDELKGQIASLTSMVQQVLSNQQQNASLQSSVLAISAKQEELFAFLKSMESNQSGFASMISEVMNKLDSIESAVLSIQPQEQRDELA